MTIEEYFEREYNYLQEAGNAFAEKHPTLGKGLRIDDRQRKDPFVERLFEAFAFLAGRIHERLDDEMPEITGGLLEQLFPHFLRPFPSCAILQINPISGAVTKPLVVPRNSEVQTPTGRVKVIYRVSSGPREVARTLEKTEMTEFIFRTTQDTLVRPMRLKEVRVEDTPAGTSALVLQIQPERNVTFEQLDLKRLQLYLQGSEFLKYNLLAWLTRHVESVSVAELVGNEKKFVKINNAQIGIPELSPGFEAENEEYALVPYARQIFKGYRLLHEYFSFPEKFSLLEIRGLDQFAASGEEVPFEIKFTFDRRISGEVRPTLQNILLHCTPVVNLFDRSTEEVIVNQRMPEYYIIPDLDRQKSREIYSVNRVTGISENKLEQYRYIPVTSYEILEVEDPDYDFKRFFSTTLRPVRGDMAGCFIRIFSPAMETGEFKRETLSLEATMSNGLLPSKYLQIQALTEPINFPGGVTVSNITIPSDVLPNPERKNYLWALISHLTLSYSTLANTDTLKSVLSLYNWSQSYTSSNKKRIGAIKKVHPPVPKSIFRNRNLIRGIEFRIEIDPAEIDFGEGEIHLLGLVLIRFLSQYVTINSYVILTIIELGTNRQYTWEPNLGKILPV
jgi:type VI secretion system protein ImpG